MKSEISTFYIIWDVLFCWEEIGQSFRMYMETEKFCLVTYLRYPVGPLCWAFLVARFGLSFGLISSPMRLTLDVHLFNLINELLIKETKKLRRRRKYLGHGK